MLFFGFRAIRQINIIIEQVAPLHGFVGRHYGQTPPNKNNNMNNQLTNETHFNEFDQYNNGSTTITTTTEKESEGEIIWDLGHLYLLGVVLILWILALGNIIVVSLRIWMPIPVPAALATGGDLSKP